MAYYNKNVIEAEFGSYDPSQMEYAHNWEDEPDCERKRVKIIHMPSKDEEITFENKINSYIKKNMEDIKIIDIKYHGNSVMIIYELNKI